MRDADLGAAWLRGWTAAWFVAIALLATCCASRPQAREPEPTCPAPRTITVTLKCLTMPPPKHPELAGDAAIDKARLEQAYDELRLWVELYAWPSCRDR